MIKKIILIIVCLFTIVSCGNGNPFDKKDKEVNYVEPTKEGEFFYIDFYNRNHVHQEENMITELYKDFGGYRDNIHIVWYVSNKQRGIDRGWDAFRYEDLYFIFDYSDTIYVFHRGREFTLEEAINGEYNIFTDAEIRDFHSRYWEFVYSEREKGNL